MLNASGPELQTSAHRAALSKSSPMNENLANPRADLELLSVRQVAELFHVSRLSVYRLIEYGLVPVYRVLRCVRFRRADITNFLAKNCTSAWRDELYGRKKD